MIAIEFTNQGCGQNDIASIVVDRVIIGVWSSPKVFVTKRPAGVETLAFLFGKRDSAELLLDKALGATLHILKSTTRPDCVKDDSVSLPIDMSYSKAFDCAVNAHSGAQLCFGESNKPAARIDSLAVEHASIRHARKHPLSQISYIVKVTTFFVHLRPPTTAITYRVHVTSH